MEKAPKPQELTPGRIAEIRKERIFSDATAIKKGAKIDAEGKLHFTAEQRRGAKLAMENHFTEKRAQLPKHGKKNWKDIVELLGHYQLGSEYNRYIHRSGDRVVVQEQGGEFEYEGAAGYAEKPSRHAVRDEDLTKLRGMLLDDIEKRKKEIAKERKRHEPIESYIEGVEEGIKKYEEAVEFIDAEIEARKNRKGNEKTPFERG